jgi:hypothetical protein
MILVPAAGVVAGGLVYRHTGSGREALEMAGRGAMTVFGGWALAREIAPDDNPGAFVSLALAALALMLVPAASVLPLFTAIMLARIINRSVGYPAAWYDSLAVTFLAGWTAYRLGSPGIALVAAAGFGLDAILPAPSRFQWLFAMLCLVGTVLLVLAGAEPVPGAGAVPILPIMAAAILYPLVIALTRQVRAVADRGGQPLSVSRVKGAMALVWMMGLEGALAGEPGLMRSLLIWAVITGLLLTYVARPGLAAGGR